MFYRSIIFFFLFISINGLAQENKKLKQILTELDDFQKKEIPSDTVISNHPFGRFTEDDHQRRGKYYDVQLEKLKSINHKTLNSSDQINLELAKFKLIGLIIPFRYQSYLNPILSDEGFHTVLPRYANRTLNTARDISIYLNYLKAIPVYVDQHLDLMRKGLILGISQPKIALEGFESGYNTHIVTDVSKSIFWKPFENKPLHINGQEWESNKEEAKKIIYSNVISSYEKIRTFFEKEYLPASRKTLAATSFPNGKMYYMDLVRLHTTTMMTPDEVFEIGMKEVSRIRKEMDEVISQVGFKGSFQEFIQFLRTDKKFYPATAEDLLKEASFISKKIDGQLPKLFGKLPRQPYGVEPVPDYLAPNYTTGRYIRGSGKIAGKYWVNTYDLKSRTLHTLEALTLHEAVPGHHLQIALAQELTGIPAFRQSLNITAFSEGWGLYSEYLGYELGLYKDPYSVFGRLTYEMWRACRLVIDVGIHWKNWTREESVKFLAENTALSLHEVNTEVNRYIAWPGQALAYKIGELRFRELRKKAEAALKEKFDIRKFHDLVLSEGPVTLAILEGMVDRFIEKERH